MTRSSARQAVCNHALQVDPGVMWDHEFLQIFWKSLASCYLFGGFNHECYFPFHIWDVILPNWRTPSFFRRGGLNHQPVLELIALLILSGAYYIYIYYHTLHIHYNNFLQFETQRWWDRPSDRGGSSIGLGKDADSAAVASLPGQPQHRWGTTTETWRNFLG